LVWKPEKRLVSTIYGKFCGETKYAIEVADSNAGSALDQALGFLQLEESEIEGLMSGVTDSGGVYYVPALSGL
jgi:glycerol kinase